MLVSAKLKVYCVCGVYRDAVGASTDSWLSLARRGLVRAGTLPSAAGAMELLGVATNSKPTHARIPLHPLGPRHTPTYTRIHTHAAMDNLGKISAFGKTFSYVRVTAKCRRRHRPQAARLAERDTQADMAPTALPSHPLPHAPSNMSRSSWARPTTRRSCLPTTLSSRSASMR
jgi:hypothetical protein